jgi:hypothetical protein
MPCDIDAWIQRQLAAAPPLSQATKAKLAALLSGRPAPGADEPARRADEAA